MLHVTYDGPHARLRTTESGTIKRLDQSLFSEFVFLLSGPTVAGGGGSFNRLLCWDEIIFGLLVIHSFPHRCPPPPAPICLHRLIPENEIWSEVRRGQEASQSPHRYSAPARQREFGLVTFCKEKWVLASNCNMWGCNCDSHSGKLGLGTWVMAQTSPWLIIHAATFVTIIFL